MLQRIHEIVRDIAATLAAKGDIRGMQVFEIII